MAKYVDSNDVKVESTSAEAVGDRGDNPNRDFVFGDGGSNNDGKGHQRRGNRSGGGGGNRNHSRGSAGGGGAGGGQQGNFKDKRRFNKSNFNEEHPNESYNAPPRHDYLQEKLYEISGPTLDLPPMDMCEKKFNGRNRLYIGNISSEVTEEDIVETFGKLGEISDIFINKEKNFGFVSYDFHVNAEKAKRELDGFNLKGKPLKIRFSPRAGSSIKVTNLLPSVTNELLYHGFQIFGDIEKAIISVDERGKSTGTGIVDFVRKKSAVQAIRECNDGCFFLTSTLRPCIVEPYEPVADQDGYGEKVVPWRNAQFVKEREVGPWFAKRNSFEYEFGMKWKQLVDLYKQKEDALKKDLALDEEKLDAQMGFAKYEYETEMLKKELETREMYWERQKMELEQKERQAAEQRIRNEQEMRRREEQIQSCLVRHEEPARRHQDIDPYNARASFYEQQGNWDSMRYRDEGYWQRETAHANHEEPVNSNSRSEKLPAPPVWESPVDDQNGDLFQRRSESALLEAERSITSNYVSTREEGAEHGKRRHSEKEPGEAIVRPSWDDSYPSKRNRF